MSPRKQIPELGPLEFKLVRLLWQCGSLTAPEVLEAYNEQAETPLAYTTVRTLLGRLVDKGALTANKERQPYRFSPAITREQTLRQRISEFVDVFFEGEPVELALRLVQDTPLSEESVEKLEQVLREHKSKAKSKRA